MARCEYSCAYLLPIEHTRLRGHRAPAIPHALCFQGGKSMHTSGASRREIAKVCHTVIASAAKQSMLQHKERVDCFAPLAMTIAERTRHTPIVITRDKPRRTGYPACAEYDDRRGGRARPAPNE